MNESHGKKRKWPKWKLILLYVIGTIIVLFITNSVLIRLVQTTIRKQLNQLSPTVKISYSSINMDLFTLSLSFHDVAILFSPDTSDKQHQHCLKSPDVEFSGINFFKAIFNKNLSIHTLKLERANIYIDQFLLAKKDSIQHDLSADMPFNNISIDHFEISKSNVWLRTSQVNSILLKGDISLDKVSMNNLNKLFPKNNFHLAFFQCHLSEISYSIPGTFHTLHVKQVVINSDSILRIDSLKIIPLFSKIKNDEKTSQQLNSIEATVSRIQVLKVDFMKLLDQRFIAGKVFINGSNIHIFNRSKKTKPSQSQTLPFNYFNHIPRETRIDSFIVNHSSINYEVYFKEDLKTNLPKAKGDPDSIHSANISINHLEIKEAGVRVYLKQENKFNIDKIVVSNFNNFDNNDFHFDALQCNLSKIVYSIPDEYYTLHIKKLMIDSKKSISRIDSIAIIPRYGKFKFGEKMGHQADRLEATIAAIEISKLDAIKLFHKKLIADNISVNNTMAHVFRDRRLPREFKKQPMANGYLKNIPLEVRLNTFKINNAFVDYEEFPKDGTETGTLKIAKMNMSMSPVLNHPHKNDLHYSDTYINGSIMNSGTIEASIHAPMEGNIYAIKGAIKDLDLSKLSSSAENLGKFHIESGILNNLDFHFIATEEKATGEIVGEYHNLVVDKLKEKKGGKKIAKVPSFLLKHFIIPKNKDKSMNVAKRTGKINYKRDPTRLITFYFLKSLLSGITASFNLGFLLPQ